MGEESKLKKLATTKRTVGEAESWIFSLTPVFVAFAFYVMFILTSNFEQKGLFMAYGATAGLIGLETYWIVRGWRKHHGSTVIMGILGIVITLGLLKMFLSYYQHIQ